MISSDDKTRLEIQAGRQPDTAGSKKMSAHPAWQPGWFSKRAARNPKGFLFPLDIFWLGSVAYSSSRLITPKSITTLTRVGSCYLPLRTLSYACYK